MELPLPRRRVTRTPVFIVDDHALVRAGVRAELGDDVVVGEAADVADRRRRHPAHQPDVVLLDVHLPGGGGPAVIERCDRTARRPVPGAVGVRRRRGRHRRHPGRGPRLRHQDHLRPGPDSTPSGGSPTGDVVFSPRLAGFVLDAFRRRGPPARPAATDPELDQLTPREREVMRLLARGYAYREIGPQLFISVKTVETHASNVLRKLQLSNRYELSRWAATNRLL